ncbi:hypothetical protein HanPSC8_Chr06g0246471 [Helianthus annuus]|nr:hypothetical protein HanPSC8_Chr06g0246471 [Helianthus annuus]
MVVKVPTRLRVLSEYSLQVAEARVLFSQANYSPSTPEYSRVPPEYSRIRLGSA